MEINRLSSTKDDLCGVQQYYKQSVGPGRYVTTNLVPKATGVNPMAADQLLIYPREGYGYNNAAIDADSILRNQSVKSFLSRYTTFVQPTVAEPA
jgi:hypothetical protein